MAEDFEYLDKTKVNVLLLLADQFESAINLGHRLIALGIAESIARGFKTFCPRSYSAFYSMRTSELKLPEFARSLSGPYSKLDSRYVELVRQAVESFKRALTGGKMVESLHALDPTGIFDGVPSIDSELKSLEIEALRESADGRSKLLPRMAKLALWTGNFEKAERYARELLNRIAADDSFEAKAKAIHDTNMVIGLIALRRGDIQGAKYALIASARTKGSDEIRMRGPNLSLAEQLLKAGERAVVIDYLQSCQLFWPMGRNLLDKLIQEIQSGGEPQFDLLLLTQ